MYPPSNIIPCQRLNLPNIKVGITATAPAAIQNGKSSKSDWLLTGNGLPEIKAHNARIKVISITLAPIIFPTDKSAFFLTIEVIVVTSSGRDVPVSYTHLTLPTKLEV